MKKLMGFDNVLCLSPHPDDVELSMSSTISRYKDTDFHILCMSPGTATDITSRNTDRWKEVEEFWKTNRSENVVISSVKCDYPNFDGFVEIPRWITWINNFYNYIEFDAIFGPSGLDSHQEHTFVNSIMYAVVRNRPVSVIEYRTVSTLHEWIPNMFVPITEKELHDKIVNCRESFSSQLDSPYFQEKTMECFHKDFASMKKGIDYTEMFRITNHYVREE